MQIHNHKSHDSTIKNAIIFITSLLNPFTVSLQRLGADAVPSHFIHKSSYRKQVTTRSPLASCASCIGGKERMTWGHDKLQMLSGTL